MIVSTTPMSFEAGYHVVTNLHPALLHIRRHDVVEAFVVPAVAQGRSMTGPVCGNAVPAPLAASAVFDYNQRVAGPQPQT